MIYFVTALHYEAAPFIRYYKMKKKLDHLNRRWELFISEKAILIVSGIGQTISVAATAYLLTLFQPKENDIFVNISSYPKNNDSSSGETIVYNVLYDNATDRYFYPHILHKHPFREGENTECAYIFETASLFIRPENIVILKASSDSNAAQQICQWLECAENQYLPMFSHIYVEKGAEDYPLARRILSRFPNSQIILIRHHKDIFSPKNQRFNEQKRSRKLILAVKEKGFLNVGSGMCDSFGNKNFYYSTDILNCVYDCQYCYLQGMYSSANIVLYVNIQEEFKDIKRLLKSKPLYICISYNTDLLALEPLTGIVGQWLDFAEKHNNLSLEIRTKSANFSAISEYNPNPNVVLAWTVSPDEIANLYETNSPTLKKRLDNAQAAILKGWRVRICIDPVLCTDGYLKLYKELAVLIESAIDIEKLHSISIGTFRLPIRFFKKMAEMHDTELFNYPFVQSDGCVSMKEEDFEKAKKILEEIVWERR